LQTAKHAKTATTPLASHTQHHPQTHRISLLRCTAHDQVSNSTAHKSQQWTIHFMFNVPGDGYDSAVAVHLAISSASHPAAEEMTSNAYNNDRLTAIYSAQPG